MSNLVYYSMQSGLCQCGCGRATPPARRTDTQGRYVKGEPYAFLTGHQMKRSVRDRRVGRKSAGPYWRVIVKGHPLGDSGGYIYEHRAVAERALGKYLPATAVVHHVDDDGRNNDPSNLVICHDETYHKLLHRRQRAYDACGNPSAYRCHQCGGYDRQDEIVLRANIKGHVISNHHACLKALSDRHHARQRAERAANRVGNITIEAV